MNDKTDEELWQMLEDLHREKSDANMTLRFAVGKRETGDAKAQIRSVELQIKKINNELKRREFMASHIF